MTQNEKTTKALTTLIVINNDRYEGYKKAAEETNETDLKSMFSGFSLQSKSFANDLRKFIPEYKDEPKDDKTTAAGKLYRVWMDIKSGLATNNRKAVLSSCEFGEDVALKTYKEVLDNIQDIPANIASVITNQKQEIQKGHDTVKTMRDSEVVA